MIPGRQSQTAPVRGTLPETLWRPCNNKLTDKKRTDRPTKTKQTDTLTDKPTLQKKIKTPPPHKKIKFYADPHCTHLPLPATATSRPKGKVKRVQSPTL